MDTLSPERPTLAASYFDGRVARAQPVTLQLQGKALHITGAAIDRLVPFNDVQWPERTRHGVRIAHFNDGGSVQCADADLWDAWRRDSGASESLVVKAQQSWRWVAACGVLLVAVLAGLQQWGLPVAARAIVAVTPLSVDEALGETSLSVIDGRLMQPSKLPQAEQDRLQAAFIQAVAALPPGSVPKWRLLFRKSRLGPNAFALPGGTMVMTDEMVKLVGGDEKVIVAVLAHELGHVRQRHGLRLLVQATALSGLAALVVGDFSTVLAGAPVLLGQASYSRDAEREADEEAVRILRAARISPAVMVTMFEKIEAFRREKDTEDKDGPAASVGEPAGDGKSEKSGSKPADEDSWLGIAIASHPADAERVRFFTEAAGR